MRNDNSGYIGVDKRTAKEGSYGLKKHFLERLGGNFLANISTHKVTLQDDLLAWWKFNQSSGDTAPDAIGGNAYPATLNNMSDANWVAGKTAAFGNCLEFDGVDDYLEVDSSGALLDGLDNFSISYWIRFADPDDNFTVMCKGEDSIWLFCQTYAGDAMRVYQYIRQGGTWQQANVVLGTVDTWYHVVLTADAGGGGLKSYLDGSLAGTGSLSSSPATNSDNLTIMSGNGNAAGGGTQPTITGPGRLDDIRFYGVTLSASDVAAIYGGGNGDFE